MNRHERRAAAKKKGGRLQMTWDEAARFERICRTAGIPFSFGTPPVEYRKQWDEAVQR
jgi:hypothetical protein